MAARRIRTLLPHLQNLAACLDDPAADRELLRRFAQERDQAAFAEVVRRHGPMLLRVCRSVLRDGNDAEDVCQAAFLLLARKATSIRWHDSVAGWLFQTAHRLALKARSAAGRRKRHEARAEPRPPADPVAELTARELQDALDEELSRLPEKYRAPILLCCLEGRSRDEAARYLGWTLPAVKDCLEQGRERLRARLARRGVPLGTALTSAWLLEGGARAGCSALAPQAVAKAALSIATGQATLASLLPARVAALAEGVTTMFSSRMALLAVLGVALGTAAAVAGYRGLATPAPAAGEAPGAAAAAPADGAPRQPAKADPAKPEAGPAQPAAVPLVGHKGAVRGVAFAPDGKSVATAGADGTVRLWDPATGRQTLKLDAPGEAAGLVFSPDGTTLVAGCPGKAVIAWEASTGKKLWQTGGFGGGPVAFSPDGSMIASADGTGVGAAYEVRTGKVFFVTKLPGGGAAVAFSPDGKTLAVGNGAGGVQLLDTTGRMLMHVPGRGAVTGLAFLPGGNKLAASDGGKAVRVLDTATGREEAAFKGAEEVRALALSPDGKRMATAGKGGEVRLWDAVTKKEERQFPAADGSVNAVTFAPDGDRLATAGEDGRAVVWNLTRDEKPLPAGLKLTEKDLASLWTDLGSDEGVKAYAAAQMLRADPANAVPFLRGRLKPREAGADEAKIKKLIADLDSEKFATRETATKELEGLGKTAEAALRAALAGSPSAEAKVRLERLLKALGEGVALTAEQLRDVRAVRVLEQTGTPEAKALLEALVKESPGWWVTREAKGALERLARRQPKP